MNPSYLLVFLQFLFLGLLFLPFYLVELSGGVYFAFGCFSFSFVLLAWTVFHNRFGNFNIVPEIKEDCILITTGPYRYIRHPMYTSVMLIGTGVVLYWFSFWKIGVLALLIAVFYFKARREEGFWSEKTEEYSAYRKKSRMFIPFIL